MPLLSICQLIKTYAQLSKIIKSDWFLGNMMHNSGKKALTDLVVPLAKDVKDA